MNRDHAFVVVGCGSVGSAVLYWLSRMAAPYASVLGLERDGPARRTAGPANAVGLAGSRDADAALARAAHDAWRQVECVSGQTLVTRTGGLVVEDPDDPAARGTVDRHLAVAARHGVEVDELDAAALVVRWPQFRPRGNERAVHRPRTGVVDLRRADATHLALARGHGAEVRDATPVRAVHDGGRYVEVVTDDEVYRAEHVVVTAGAGTGRVLAGLAPPIPRVAGREQVTAYATSELIDFSPGRFPVFTWRGGGTFRGTPVLGDVTTTLCHPCGPTGRADRDRFLAAHLPGFAAGPEVHTTTRAWTVPAGGGVVLDTLRSGRVGVAAGTGRAPGLVSLAGRILAELAAAGTTRHAVAARALDRYPSVSDPVPLRSRTWT